MDLHHLGQDQPQEAHGLLPAGAHGHGILDLLSQMFVSLKLQYPLHVAERLNKRDHRQIVLFGSMKETCNVLDGVGVPGGHIVQRSPERKHVLILQ